MRVPPDVQLYIYKYVVLQHRTSQKIRLARGKKSFGKKEIKLDLFLTFIPHP